MPQQCETEKVATARSVRPVAGSEACTLEGSITSGAWVTSWMITRPCRSASAASASSSSRSSTTPYGLDGSTRQIARVRGPTASATASTSMRKPLARPAGTGTGRPPAAMTAEGRWK